LKPYKEMYVGGQALPTNIHFLVKLQILKIHNVLNIKLIFLKLWIFTNFNTVFLVLVLVFDFEEFSQEVLHGVTGCSLNTQITRLFWFINCLFPYSSSLLYYR
jgi:hypothetical protein